MNNIYCFGDSFIEHPNESDDSHRWQYILQNHFKDYGYKNFGKGGTGSIYSMQLFIDLMEGQIMRATIERNKLKENDIVVFHLSYNSRDYENSELRDGCPFIVDNNSFFCSYLYQMCQVIKFKLILFTVDIWQEEGKSDRGEYYTNCGNNTRQLFHNRMIELNDDYFHLSKIDLFRETQRELLSSQWDEWMENKDDLYYHDIRTNHMSEENHSIMAEYIINVIEKRELPSFKNNHKTLKDLFFKKETYVYD